MAQKDYYKILGVSKNATEKEIKQAFRKQELWCCVTRPRLRLNDAMRSAANLQAARHVEFGLGIARRFAPEDSFRVGAISIVTSILAVSEVNYE